MAEGDAPDVSPETFIPPTEVVDIILSSLVESEVVVNDSIVGDSNKVVMAEGDAPCVSPETVDIPPEEVDIIPSSLVESEVVAPSEEIVSSPTSPLEVVPRTSVKGKESSSITKHNDSFNGKKKKKKMMAKRIRVTKEMRVIKRSMKIKRPRVV